MLFSVIIPTYKRHEDLCKCLECLAPYFEAGFLDSVGFGVEVIVTDDAREPELKALLAERFPWCRHVDGPSQGPAANRNNGANHAAGDWLVFTDDDCLPQPGWLEAYNRAIRENPAFRVFEGRIYSSELPGILWGAPVNNGGYLWTSNMVISSKLFYSMSGFAEIFPNAAMEDVEFRTRLTDYDTEFLFIAQAEIFHPPRKISNFFKRYRSNLDSSVVYWSLHPEKEPPLGVLISNQMRNMVRRLLESSSKNVPDACLNAPHWILSNLYAVFLITKFKILKKKSYVTKVN